MPLRPGHGQGAGKPHPEVMIVGRLKSGVVAASEPLAAPVRRPLGGHVMSLEARREMGRRGGLAKARKARALRVLMSLGLHGTPLPELELYWEDADAFGKHEVARLAQVVGGGTCGASPSSMIQSAALQLAASRKLFADGQFLPASKLADASRQNLLAAHEICANEAKARQQMARDAPQASPLLQLTEAPIGRAALNPNSQAPHAPQAAQAQESTGGLSFVQAPQAPTSPKDPAK